MRAALAAIVVALVAAPGAPAADKYPTKPIRLVAPFPPGGGTDILGRVIAQPVSERLGQTVVVDNRPGAGGALGAEIVAHSTPDGYTLILVSSSYAATSAFGKPTYDPVDGIQPVILIGTTGIVLSVHPSVPATSVSEFISHVKANPGKLNYASVGTGSVTQMLMELFKLETKTDFVHVPYKGGGPALAATIGGEVKVTAISAVPSMPHIRAGRLRALGVTTLKRLSILPDVPSIGDTVPGFEVVHWYAIWAPKGTPRAIVDLWNEEVARVLRSPQMVRQMSNEGLDAAGGPPEEFYEANKSAVQKWRRVIKEAKLGTGN
jgi:tripartite-type tricarboxylate transporter receptor subunit TctC